MCLPHPGYQYKLRVVLGDPRRGSISNEPAPRQPDVMSPPPPPSARSQLGLPRGRPQWRSPALRVGPGDPVLLTVSRREQRVSSEKRGEGLHGERVAVQPLWSPTAPSRVVRVTVLGPQPTSQHADDASVSHRCSQVWLRGRVSPDRHPVLRGVDPGMGGRVCVLLEAAAVKQ